MPINPDAVGTKSEPARRKWDSKDALIYALGVGAGAVDPLAELQFTTENTSGTPAAGPAHHRRGARPPRRRLRQDRHRSTRRCSSTASRASRSTARSRSTGELESVSEITGIYDKGKGAVDRHRVQGHPRRHR